MPEEVNDTNSVDPVPAQPAKKPSGRGKRTLTISLVVLGVLLLVVGASAGIYFWQQQTINDLTSENESLRQEEQIDPGSQQEPEEPQASAPQKVAFDRPNLPFTFQHPDDWVLVIDKPLNETADISQYSSYDIIMYIPGTLDEETQMGGKQAEKGARYGVMAAKTDKTNVESIFDSPGFEHMTKDRSTTTVSGLPAVRYIWAHEANIMTTSVIKDSWQYNITMSHKDDLANSPHRQAYEELVKSFKFK